MLVLGLILALKPPYPHTDAQSVHKVENFNNQAQQKADAKPAENKLVTPEPSQPKVVPITHPVGCENYRQLISQYNWNVSVMLQIASAESGCNPYAVGDNFPIRGETIPSCGLFQVRTLAGRPSCQELQDPATNIAWAYKIYLGQGYAAWSVCKTKVHCR